MKHTLFSTRKWLKAVVRMFTVTASMSGKAVGFDVRLYWSL